jgi:hypothetical protein
VRDGELERDVRGDGVDDAASRVGAGGGVLRAVGGRRGERGERGRGERVRGGGGERGDESARGDG